jgi:hypothetical protein
MERRTGEVKRWVFLLAFQKKKNDKAFILGWKLFILL